MKTIIRKALFVLAVVAAVAFVAYSASPVLANNDNSPAKEMLLQPQDSVDQNTKSDCNKYKKSDCDKRAKKDCKKKKKSCCDKD